MKRSAEDLLKALVVSQDGGHVMDQSTLLRQLAQGKRNGATPQARGGGGLVLAALAVAIKALLLG